MSDKTPSRPTHRAYYVSGDGDKKNWRELGPVWAHSDGKGFNFTPDVLPAPGQVITIRKIEPKDKKGA